MMTRPSDNGGCERDQQTMFASDHCLCAGWSCEAQKLDLRGRRKTYGRQLAVHRHRQNRPCTYPNCEIVSLVLLSLCHPCVALIVARWLHTAKMATSATQY